MWAWARVQVSGYRALTQPHSLFFSPLPAGGGKDPPRGPVGVHAQRAAARARGAARGRRRDGVLVAGTRPLFAPRAPLFPPLL